MRLCIQTPGGAHWPPTLIQKVVIDSFMPRCSIRRYYLTAQSLFNVPRVDPYGGAPSRRVTQRKHCIHWNLSRLFRCQGRHPWAAFRMECLRCYRRSRTSACAGAAPPGRYSRETSASPARPTLTIRLAYCLSFCQSQSWRWLSESETWRGKIMFFC